MLRANPIAGSKAAALEATTKVTTAMTNRPGCSPAGLRQQALGASAVSVHETPAPGSPDSHRWNFVMWAVDSSSHFSACPAGHAPAGYGLCRCRYPALTQLHQRDAAAAVNNSANTTRATLAIGFHASRRCQPL